MSNTNTVDVYFTALRGFPKDDNPDKLSRDLGFIMIYKMLFTAAFLTAAFL